MNFLKVSYGENPQMSDKPSLSVELNEFERGEPITLKLNSSPFIRLSIEEANNFIEHLQVCMNLYKRERYKVLLIQQGEIQKELETYK